MNKILSVVLLCVGFVFADNFETSQKKSETIKMQTTVGEAAVNNILKAYFGGTHEIPVNGMGNITLTIKDMGIDIQNNNDIVFGYDMTITSDFQSTLSQLSGGHIKDNLNINGAISTKTVKRTVDNAVEKTKNAIVVLLDLNSAIEKMLNKHGIKEVPVMSAIKDFFVKKEAQVEGKLELWRQEYSTLLNAYVNKLETPLDINITSMKIDLALKNDCIVIGLEAKVQSEMQYFSFLGWKENPEIFHIISNKEFKLLKVEFWTMIRHDQPSLMYVCRTSNFGKDDEYREDYDIYQYCTDYNSATAVGHMKDFITYNNIKMNFTVLTKHGGIVTIGKELNKW